MSDCIFCQIVADQSPSYPVWEDEKHLAFLNIFPNTPGVVVTKNHYDSYMANLPDEVLADMTLAVKKVCRLIDRKLDTVSRTGVVWEGMGVNHIHAKLFPLHGTGNMKKWRKWESNIDIFFDEYPGYISSHTGPRASEDSLEEMRRKLSL